MFLYSIFYSTVYCISLVLYDLFKLNGGVCFYAIIYFYNFLYYLFILEYLITVVYIRILGYRVYLSTRPSYMPEKKRHY